jgi:hypothetical protein
VSPSTPITQQPKVNTPCDVTNTCSLSWKDGILIVQLWEKMSAGGSLIALYFFDNLKRAQEVLISVRMSPLALFYDQLINTITPVKKQQQINIHP